MQNRTKNTPIASPYSIRPTNNANGGRPYLTIAHLHCRTIRIRPRFENPVIYAEVRLLKMFNNILTE